MIGVLRWLCQMTGRIREGALSAERTPDRPPVKARLEILP